MPEKRQQGHSLIWQEKSADDLLSGPSPQNESRQCSMPIPETMITA